jgi:translocation and assembly module TamB
VTSLTLTASAQGAGFSPATMNAHFTADVAASKFDSLAIDSGSVRVTIANGLATVQKLQLSGAKTIVDASGSFGLAAGRSGTLSYIAQVDSLGALDRLLPHTGPDTGSIAPRPAVLARAVRRARADSARIAQRTEVERLATGRPLPTLVVDTPKATPNVLKGKLRLGGKLSGNLQRFNLVGRLGADSIDVHGNAARRLRAEYAWTNARTPASTMAIGLAGDTIMASGFAFDSLDARLSYRGQQQGGRVALLVRQGDQRDYGVQGDYVVSANLKQLRVADLELRFDTTLWRAPHASTISSRPAGIDVQNFELVSGTTGRIYANGLLPSKGVGNFDVAIDNFQVGDLLDVLESDLDLRGFVTVHGAMRGTLAAPTLRGALGMTGGVYKGDTVPDLRGTFNYASTALAAHLDLLHRTGAPMATVTANLPVNLALSGVVGSRLQQRPLTVDLTADSLPLGLVPAFTGFVTNVSGQAAAQVAVRGTFNQPAITGGLLLKDAAAELTTTGMYVDNLNGALRLANDSVQIDSLRARAGRGTVAVTGGIGVRTLNDPRFSLYVVAHNAEVLHNQHGRLTADAGLRLTGPLARPYLSGQVQVTGGVLEFPNPTSQHVISAGDPDIFNVVDTSLIADKDLFPAQSPILKNARVEVTLGINRNTWVRTTDANVEIFTDYPLDIHVAQSALTLTGAVGTERGDYTFLSKRFTITRGSATFVGTPDLNPTLQATGEYQVQLAGSPAMDIQVLIGGTMKHPKLTLQSDAQPPKTQSELLTLLAFGEPASNLLQPEGSSLAGVGATGGLVGQGAQLAMTRLEGVAIGVLFQQVQTQAGRALGADQFYITPGDTPELTTGTQGITSFINSTRIEGGKYLNPRTFLGVQEYSWQPGLRIEYRTSKGWMYTAYTQPQVLLAPPTLELQPWFRKQSFGALVIRQWRF